MFQLVLLRHGSFIGLGVGAAMAGLRPIVEIRGEPARFLSTLSGYPEAGTTR